MFHKNVRCFLWVAVFQLVFTHSGSFDSTPWKAIVIFSGGTPGVPTIPNHPTVLAFNFKQFKVDLFHRSSSLDWVFGFFCWTLARLYPLLDLASKCEQKRHIQPQAHNQSFFPTNYRTKGKISRMWFVEILQSIWSGLSAENFDWQRLMLLCPHVICIRKQNTECDLYQRHISIQRKSLWGTIQAACKYFFTLKPWNCLWQAKPTRFIVSSLIKTKP